MAEEYAKQNAAAVPADHLTKIESPPVAEGFPKVANDVGAWANPYATGNTQAYPTTSGCTVNDYHQMTQQNYANNSLSVTAKYWSWCASTMTGAAAIIVSDEF